MAVPEIANPPIDIPPAPRDHTTWSEADDGAMDGYPVAGGGVAPRGGGSWPCPGVASTPGRTGVDLPGCARHPATSDDRSATAHDRSAAVHDRSATAHGRPATPADHAAATTEYGLLPPTI